MTVSEVPASLRSWMSAVSEIARAVNAAEPLDSVLTTVARLARELIGFEYCAVMLADPARECLRVAGWCGLCSEYVALVNADGSLPIHPPDPELDTPAARAYRECQTVAVPDVASAPEYRRLRRLAPTQGYRALLAAPLRGADLVGVIVGYSITAREFAAPERELIELLAGQVALAVETAGLRATQQRVISELSRANQELSRGRAALEWAELRHHELMRLVLSGAGLSSLVGALATTLNASVTVEDADGRVLARAPENGYRPPPDAAARRREPARTALAAQRGDGSVAGADPAHRYAVAQVPVVRANGPSVPGAPGVREPEMAWAAPVVLGGELVGRLWLTAPAAAPQPLQLRVVERFALVVALELLRERHLLDVRGRLSGDLLEDLLRVDGPMLPQVVVERAAALGHELTRPHLVAVLAVDGPAPPVLRLLDVVRAAADPGPRPLAGRYDGLYVLLLPTEPDPSGALRRILAQAAVAVGSEGTPTLVAGPVVAELSDYARAFRVARAAAALRRSSRPGGLVDVRELGLSALLLETGAPDALRRFARSLLGPVVVHEERRGGDLLATLRTWLAEGCSTAATASALVVHPNTVGYRLSRIEQLVGRSLRDTQVRLELQLALVVREIMLLDERAPTAKSSMTADWRSSEASR